MGEGPAAPVVLAAEEKAEHLVRRDHGAEGGADGKVGRADQRGRPDPGLFFVLDVNAELWEYSTWLSRWVWHGRPDDAFLAIQPAAVLPDSNAVGSLFFRTTDGRVFERYFNQFRKSWMWVDHGSPIVAKLAGPPGAVLFNNRIHFVGTDGHLWALVFRSNDETGDGWKWTDCGIPGVPLAIMRPVRISTAGVGILTVDGKLAERTWSAKLELWKWRTNELPEGSALGSPPGTKYCSPEPMSPLNCVRAAKSTGHLDLVNPNKQVLRQLQQNLEQKVIEMEGAVSPEGRSFVEGGNADQSGKRKKKKKKNRAGKKGSGTSKKKKGSTLARDALAKSDGGMT